MRIFCFDSNSFLIKLLRVQLLLILFLSYGVLNSANINRRALPNSSELTVLSVSGAVIYAGVWGKGFFRSADGAATWTENSNGLSNKYITCIVIDSKNNIYVGTRGGVFKSDGGSTEWTAIDKGLGNKEITSITVNHLDDIFVGTKGYGVFRLYKDKDEWKEINYGLKTLNISALEANEIGITSVILAGTVNSGIMRSTDNGDSWYRSSNGIEGLNIISLQKNSKSEIYACTADEGVFYTLLGSRWYKESTLPDSPICTSIVSNAAGIVAATYDRGVMRHSTTNNEFEESNIDSVGINSIVRRIDGMILAAVAGRGLFKSIDGGMSFQFAGFAASNEKTIVAMTEDNAIFLYSDNMVYKSIDAGNTFDEFGFAGHNTNSFCFDESDIYVGTDDGIYQANKNSGEEKLLGLKGNSFKAMMYDGEKYIYAGTSDNRIMKFTSDLSETEIYTLDVKYPDPVIEIIINDNAEIYAATASQGIFEYNEFSDQWGNLFDMNDYDEYFVYDIDFDSQGHLYMCNEHGLVYSNNQGASWIGAGFDPNVFEARAIAISDEDNLYVAADSGRTIYYSDDLGKHWHLIKTEIPRSEVSNMISGADGEIFVLSSSLFSLPDFMSLRIPDGVYPENGSGGIDRHPFFKYSIPSRADVCRIQISTDPQFNSIFEEHMLASDSCILKKYFDYNKEYYWRTAAVYNRTYSDWSEVYSFSTILKKTELLSPADETQGLGKTVDFSWRAVEDAEHYKFELAFDVDFTDPVIEPTAVADTVFNVFVDDSYTDYYWRVSAASSISTGENSEVWKFSSAAFALRSVGPKNGLKDMPTELLFSWEKDRGAQSYQLQISKSSDFVEPQYDITGIESTTYTVSDLDNSATYYWQARSEFADDFSPWSTTWSFATEVGVSLTFSPPELISPANEATEIDFEPRLEWASVSEAEHYKVEIAKDIDFAEIFAEAQGIQTTYFETGIEEYNTEFFWRVSAYSSEFTSDWSDIYKFTTKKDLAVNDHEAEKYSLHVFPNPAADQINISLRGFADKILKIRLIDIDGNILFEESLHSGITPIIQIDTSKLPQGAYVTELIYSGGVISECVRIVK